MEVRSIFLSGGYYVDVLYIFATLGANEFANFDISATFLGCNVLTCFQMQDNLLSVA
jgi:hypothetical protein